MPGPDSLDGGRTHEPSLRELTAELDGVRAMLSGEVRAINKVMDERDRRYEERFRATDERTLLALTSSDKAVNKAETATEKRFDSVNEFRGSLKDQASTLMPRAEAETKFSALGEKMEDLKKEIQSLRESRSVGVGKEVTETKGLAQRNTSIALFVTLALFGVSSLIGIVEFVVIQLRK